MPICEQKPRKISTICIDQNQESQPSSDIDDSEEVIQSEDDCNPDTKIVFDFLGTGVDAADSNVEGEDSSEIHDVMDDKKGSHEMPNHNGIISIKNIPEVS